MEEKVEKVEVCVEEAWKIVRTNLYEATLKRNTDILPECLGLPMATKEQQDEIEKKVIDHVKFARKECGSFSDMYGKVAVNCDSLAEFIMFLHIFWRNEKARAEKDPMEILAKMLGGK